MNTKNISLVSSVVILILSGVGYYFVQQKNNFPVSVPQDITMMASTTTDTVSVGEPSIRVDSFKSEGPATITVSYSNLPKTTSALAVCQEGGACSEWVESFHPQLPSGSYIMSVKKAFSENSNKGLGFGRLKIVVIGNGFSNQIVESDVFEVLQKYTDDKFHYSISYPASFALANDITKDLVRGRCPKESEFGHSILGICYVGTETQYGFSNAHVDLNVSNINKREDCEFKKLNIIDDKQKKIINGIEFSKGHYSIVGVGSQRHAETFLTYNNNQCYEIDLILDSNFDKPEDVLGGAFSEKMLKIMRVILDTFSFVN